MKKVLVSLLVLAVAVSGAFAAVNISGNFVTGYVFNFDDDGNFTSGIFGQDNINTNSTKLTLGFGDDTGIWSVGLEGELYADGSSVVPGIPTSNPDGSTVSLHPQNRVAGDITIDFAKMVSAETEWSAKLGLLANDRVTGLRAYSNKSGQSYDRVRTAEPGMWANLTLGYGSLIQVQVGGAPALTVSNAADKVGSVDISTGKWTGKTEGDLIASVMSEPISGLAVSVDWALVGDQSKASTSDDDGLVGGAVEANIGELVGLDFDLGIGFADRYYYGLERNDLAVQVYGGIDAFSAYAEYALIDMETSKLHIGADFNVVDHLVLNAYFGSTNVEKFADALYVGANVGYEVYGVTFQLNLQYANGGASGILGDVPQGGVKTDGFSITPMVKVNF